MPGTMCHGQDAFAEDWPLHAAVHTTNACSHAHTHISVRGQIEQCCMSLRSTQSSVACHCPALRAVLHVTAQHSVKAVKHVYAGAACLCWCCISCLCLLVAMMLGTGMLADVFMHWAQNSVVCASSTDVNLGIWTFCGAESLTSWGISHAAC